MSLKGQVSLLEEEVLQLQERLTKLELGSWDSLTAKASIKFVNN
jgi:hypothetical protein